MQARNSMVTSVLILLSIRLWMVTSYVSVNSVVRCKDNKTPFPHRQFSSVTQTAPSSSSSSSPLLHSRRKSHFPTSNLDFLQNSIHRSRTHRSVLFHANNNNNNNPNNITNRNTSPTPRSSSSSPSSSTEPITSSALSSVSSEFATAVQTPSSPVVTDPDNTTTSKLLNLLLLTAFFGYAIYSVIDIDHGMTRGWSVTEKAMRIPLDNWSSYEASLNRQPVVTKTYINVVVYCLGDWLSQTVFVGNDPLEFDARRTLRSGIIGLGFGPLVHQYYQFSDAILPVEVGFNRLYKILMDQTIYLSVKCTMYMVAVNMLSGETFEDSLAIAKSKIRGVMFAGWKFWPMVHCVTYGVIPARHRILWVNCIDLVWNAILALKTGGKEEEQELELEQMQHMGSDVDGEADQVDPNVEGDSLENGTGTIERIHVRRIKID